MSNVFLKQVFSGQVNPITKPTQNFQSRKNPFLQASGMQGVHPDEIGVNQPLHHPMFVGYKNDKAIFAGSRLFVLY